MAFTVQDDTGTVTGANAYVSEAAFKVYHADRGSVVSTFTDPQIQQAIVRATDFMDGRFRFVGEKLNNGQPTEWPRLDAFDVDDDLVSGVPQAVKDACSEYAFVALSQAINPNPTLDATGRVVQSKREKVGPIEEQVTYVGGAGFVQPRYPAADAKLRRLGLTLAGGTLARG